MDNRNICKFVPYHTNEHITTTNFVYECNASDERNMQFKQNHTMNLVISGTGSLCNELFEKELKTGDMFFTFSGSVSGIRNTGELHYMYITFNGLRADDLFRRFGISPVCSVFSGYQELIPFWKTSLGKANEKNLDLISESVLMYSFSQMSVVKENSREYLISDVLKYVEEHFSRNETSLTTTAQALGYSEKYISRVFKENIGVTFSEHLKNVRLQYATFLMEQGITSVKNIAYLCGYQDPFYFSNVFKKTVGISPSEFIACKEYTKNTSKA